MGGSTSAYKKFIFEDYNFDHDALVLHLRYSFDSTFFFEEQIEFYGDTSSYDRALIDRISFYYWIMAGTSYYKAFYVPEFELKKGSLTQKQADFFNSAYLGGLSQYIFENKLDPKQIAQFVPTSQDAPQPLTYSGEGVLLMESGGKDSILSAELLKANDKKFTSWYMGSTGSYPREVFELIGAEHRLAKRTIDLAALHRAQQNGALNGHVPFSAIYAGAALIHAVLTGKKYVFASNEASADEGNVKIDGLVINHQFSKTYQFELDLQDYIHTTITTGLEYASLLRPLSEVRVAELFADIAWEKYKGYYSSCNRANYKQGGDGETLQWCGECPKCANSFLLFAPLVNTEDLLDLFNGKNLLNDPVLHQTFLQLLGKSESKPFECVATFAEMQYSYQQAMQKSKAFFISGIDPGSTDFDPNKQYPYQHMLDTFIDYQAL